MFIGIDVGTGSLKAALGSERGLHTISQKYPSTISTPANPGVHLIPVFMESLDLFMKQIVDYSLMAGEPLTGIGLCGHGPSLLILDSRGFALTDIVTWQDRGAVGEARALSSMFPGFTKDGTCFEAKLYKQWKENPEFFSEGSVVFYPKDYIIYLLTGEKSIDHSSAATFSYYDPESHSFSTGQTGIPSEIFPPILNSWDIAGRTGTEDSRRWGIADDIPVISGGIDAWCEALGAGALHSGDFVDGTGTSTCITCCKGAEESGLIHVIPEKNLSIETMSSTGASVKWLSGILNSEINDLDSLLSSISQGQPLSPYPILFQSYLNGERSPVWDEQASVSITGLTGEHGRIEVFGSMIQGIAFGTRQCLELADRRETAGNNAGTEHSVNLEKSVVHAVGGGAAGRALVRYKADITGRVYCVMKEKDAAPLGAMILAAYGCGEGSLEELVDYWCEIESEVVPSLKYKDLWEELYDVYIDYFDQVKQTEHRLFDIAMKLK